jgi:hypothetical protein
MFDVVYSLGRCADGSEFFLTPSIRTVYEPQFRAAMTKRACRATGERGSASKIINIAAGYGDGSSKVRL